MRRTAFGLITLSRPSQQQDISLPDVSSQLSSQQPFFQNQILTHSHLFIHDYNMKFRRFTLAMALIMTSSSSPVDVAAFVNRASVYSRKSLNLLQCFEIDYVWTLTNIPAARKTTILEDIAVSGANLDKRHLSADTDLNSFLDIVDDKIASLSGYDHYPGRQQTDSSSVGLDYIDEGTPTNTSAMSTPTVDVYDENGYLIIHSYTLSMGGEPEENTPSGLIEVGLAIAALFHRKLFSTDDNDTHANPSLSANASSSPSGPGPAPLLVKRNSIDGIWGGQSWIIGALLGAGFVLFVLASCCFRYKREENVRDDMEYNYRRHEEVSQQAYVHQQSEFDRLRRAEEFNQLHQREFDRSTWHSEACAGPNHTHDDSADPPSVAELAYACRQCSQSCHACRACRATQTSPTYDSTPVDVNLQEPPQIYRAYTHTRHDDLSDHEDHWVEVYPVRYPVRYPIRRDPLLSSGLS